MTWTSGPVCIDDLVTVQAQYRPDERWNGWLCPRLDAHAVEEVMAALAADELAEDPPTHEWAPYGDLLMVAEYDGDDVYIETLAPDEDGLYALGAYGWCWSAAE